VGKKQFKDDTSKIEAFVKDSLSRIDGSTSIQETAKDTDIVIEAIVEKLEVKQKLFSSIDGVSTQNRHSHTENLKKSLSSRSLSLQPFLRATRLQFPSEKSP
jgi:3-hydroxyacyl-CoA dehydrogenase, NAD binding domain